MVVSILKLMNSSSKLIPLMWKKKIKRRKGQPWYKCMALVSFYKKYYLFFLPINLFSQIYSLYSLTQNILVM